MNSESFGTAGALVPVRNAATGLAVTVDRSRAMTYGSMGALHGSRTYLDVATARFAVQIGALARSAARRGLTRAKQVSRTNRGSGGVGAQLLHGHATDLSIPERDDGEDARRDVGEAIQGEHGDRADSLGCKAGDRRSDDHQ